MFILSFLFALQCVCSECNCEIPDTPFVDICDNPMPFRDSTLWKPDSDTRDGIAVLLRADLPDFEFCEVKLKDGSWAMMTGGERTNGNRQTYRYPENGASGAYAGNRKEGGVRCFIGDGICQFLIPGPPRLRHE